MFKINKSSRFFITTFLSLSSLLTLLTSCSHQISPNVYSDASLEEASVAYRGTVVSVRQVVVENSEKLENNAVGLIAGGVAGGVIGNQFGGGSGKSVTTVAGALLGAAAGASAGQALSTQDAYEYVVELNNGEIRVVVQGMDAVLFPGQPVLLISNRHGRPRLIPDASAMP